MRTASIFNKNTIPILISVFFLGGCTVVNFSANYYDPPQNYRDEVMIIWRDVTEQMKLKYAYQLRIVEGEVSDKLNGVPSISNRIVLIPDDFIKYVYQNYYNDRIFIIGSVTIHELCHSEFDLPSSPPQEHVKADLAAIKTLGDNEEMAISYFRALHVMQNYWFARKGMGGHALNAGWNIANAASLAFTGSGYFRDWFATDLKARMKLIKKHYGIKVYHGFEHSKD